MAQEKKKPGRPRNDDSEERSRSLSLKLSPENEATLRTLQDRDGRSMTQMIAMIEAHVNGLLGGGELFRIWQADRARAEAEVGAQFGLPGAVRAVDLPIAGTIMLQGREPGELVPGPVLVNVQGD